MRPSDLMARSLVDLLPHSRKSVAGSGGGGKTAAQMMEEHRAVMDTRPMRVRCSQPGCGYSYRGLAGRALELMAAHRELRHPELVAVGKGKRAREHRRAVVLAKRREQDAKKRAAA